MTRIIGVAILSGGKVYTVPAPARHHHVFFTMANAGQKCGAADEVQGFVTDDGDFVDRTEALPIAQASGQFNRKPGGYDGPELFSEDLW